MTSKPPALLFDLTHLNLGDRVRLEPASMQVGGAYGRVLGLVSQQEQEWARAPMRAQRDNYNCVQMVDGPEQAQLIVRDKLFWVVTDARDQVLRELEAQVAGSDAACDRALSKATELQEELTEQKEALAKVQQALADEQRRAQETGAELKQARETLRKYEADLGQLRKHFGTAAIATALYPDGNVRR